MESILRNYRRRLLNLGSGNRSLVLLRLYRELHLDAHALDFLNGKPAFSVLEQLLQGRKKISLCPYTDPRDTHVATVSRRLRMLRRKAEMLFEERGSKELFLGWPFVHGQFPDGTLVRCPLLFFPVRLQVNTRQEWELQLSEERVPQFNQSFLLAYAHYTGTAPAEELLELDLSTLPAQPLEFRTQVYELLKAQGISINIGRGFFSDKLEPFAEYRKAAFEAEHKPGQLQVRPEAVLGIFPQAASYLLADYDALLAQGGVQELEQLFGTAGAGNVQALPQEQQTFTAFAMDASQEAALQAVKQGKSVVVQGPPGTGKSQLICNLVTDFTARGKKVLVVSQKRAALDVVHQRLAKKGLALFVGLVHDINTDRKEIFNQLREQVEAVETYKKENLALNSIYTDRVFLETSRSINQALGTLEQFRGALFDSSGCGWSAKELYLRSSLQAPHIPLPPYFKGFTAATLPDFLPRLRQYLSKAIPWQREDFVWRKRRSMQGYTWRQRQELEQLIRTLPDEHRKNLRQLQELSGYTHTLEQLPDLVKALPEVERLQQLLAEEGVEQALPSLLQHEQTEQVQQALVQLKELYLVCPAPDAAIPEQELKEVTQAIRTYEQQREQWLKRITWVFSPEKQTLAKALGKYKLELNEAGVGELLRRLGLRKQATALIAELNRSTKLNLGLSQTPTQVLHKLQALELALQAHKLLGKLHQAQLLHKRLWQEAALPQHLQVLATAVQAAATQRRQWLSWLTPEQVQRLVADEEYKQALLQELPEVFEALVAYDALQASFTEAEREIAATLLAQDIADAEAGEALFLNSLYLSWLHELEAQQPLLRMPSNGEINRLEAELQRLLPQKQELSQEIIRSKLREQTYQNLEVNRLGNQVTYRRLHAQVSKKRSLYPLRKLFSLFSSEMLDLVPCWLASPETVSAVLPLEQCFDLVIFDEASQCFAETGVPAMVRGKQVVIAGDAQQLQPSDLYRTRWKNGEEEELEELTAESLLALCALYLPQTMLTQHYRSRYPELIEFSNRYFYKDKLELIPELQDANAREPAIKFVKVHGQWLNNQNLPEAQKVVELVLQHLQAGQEELGVITFNYSQQMLVQDLLEEEAQAKNITLPATLLVKNIENIQGDEKEVIILSVGYAPDERGKFAMQFGSLNQSGGENRLNVAITRAKQKVYVVSSIRAEQLQVEQSTHLGPKLLKEYLHYAQQVSRRYFSYEYKQEELVPGQMPLLKDALRQAVPALRQEVPFADLTLLLGQQYRGVVLTDDDLYLQQPSVRHAHADVPRLLQLRHWPYLRLYSRQFWEKPEQTLEVLKTRFSDAAQKV